MSKSHGAISKSHLSGAVFVWGTNKTGLLGLTN